MRGRVWAGWMHERTCVLVLLLALPLACSGALPAFARFVADADAHVCACENARTPHLRVPDLRTARRPSQPCGDAPRTLRRGCAGVRCGPGSGDRPVPDTLASAPARSYRHHACVRDRSSRRLLHAADAASSLPTVVNQSADAVVPTVRARRARSWRRTPGPLLHSRAVCADQGTSIPEELAFT